MLKTLRPGLSAGLQRSAISSPASIGGYMAGMAERVDKGGEGEFEAGSEVEGFGVDVEVVF